MRHLVITTSGPHTYLVRFSAGLLPFGVETFQGPDAAERASKLRRDLDAGAARRGELDPEPPPPPSYPSDQLERELNLACRAATDAELEFAPQAEVERLTRLRDELRRRWARQIAAEVRAERLGLPYPPVEPAPGPEPALTSIDSEDVADVLADVFGEAVTHG